MLKGMHQRGVTSFRSLLKIFVFPDRYTKGVSYKCINYKNDRKIVVDLPKALGS